MALEIEHVSKRFGKYTAVDDLSLSIPEKTILVFRREWSGKDNNFSNHTRLNGCQFRKCFMEWKAG